MHKTGGFEVSGGKATRPKWNNGYIICSQLSLPKPVQKHIKRLNNSLISRIVDRDVWPQSLRPAKKNQRHSEQLLHRELIQREANIRAAGKPGQVSGGALRGGTWAACRPNTNSSKGNRSIPSSFPPLTSFRGERASVLLGRLNRQPPITVIDSN